MNEYTNVGSLETRPYKWEQHASKAVDRMVVLLDRMELLVLVCIDTEVWDVSHLRGATALVVGESWERSQPESS